MRIPDPTLDLQLFLIPAHRGGCVSIEWDYRECFVLMEKRENEELAG
jgi:hypothetical protein